MLDSLTPIMCGASVCCLLVQCCPCGQFGHLAGLCLHYTRNAQCGNWGYREEAYAKRAHLGGQGAGRGVMERWGWRNVVFENEGQGNSDSTIPCCC